MKLQYIKPGVVVWNKWETSSIGRNTGTNSAYFLVLEVGEIKESGIEGKRYNSVSCRVKEINGSDEKKHYFDDEDISKNWLKMVTKSQLMKMKIKALGRIEKNIIEHKTNISLLEIELFEIDDKYKEFIDNAI